MNLHDIYNHLVVASGKYGFTTLRNSNIKKAQFLSIKIEKLDFFRYSGKAPFNGITLILKQCSFVNFWGISRGFQAIICTMERD